MSICFSITQGLAWREQVGAVPAMRIATLSTRERFDYQPSIIVGGHDTTVRQRCRLTPVFGVGTRLMISARRTRRAEKACARR